MNDDKIATLSRFISENYNYMNFDDGGFWTDSFYLFLKIELSS